MSFNKAQLEEYSERERLIKQLDDERRHLVGNSLSQLIAYDIVINELNIDQERLWYFYYSMPTDEVIAEELEKARASLFEEEMSEENIRKEYSQEAEKHLQQRKKLEILDSYFSELIKRGEDSLYDTYCTLREKYPHPWSNSFKAKE